MFIGWFCLLVGIIGYLWEFVFYVWIGVIGIFGEVLWLEYCVL